ncbi:MAG: 16S rRNA (adenine(1518)-N(6)/adenine(1519)-N(6))-dimethyltransferase RsmA [Desulfobacterota bacterium]|jgi:16S rRNA (adenine1518-N6/adenine1519-N6)-dimethyltransferase|nr:16S rRNA (adenine(1518)-N(6)/adenine(1519)-N(6))-dimethyltransferase RsmA [Thermodesulfobacteriota bacterium]
MKNFKTLPPLKSLGQNFLRYPDTAQRILDALPLDPGEAVVELGAGQGALTFLLGEKAGSVLALEVDAGLAEQLTEKIRGRGRENIRVLHEDMLKADWGSWWEDLKQPFWIVGNLPYQLSTAVLFRVIEFRSILKGAYVMLQKEVADRLLGQPGQKAYGLMTVLIGYYAEVKPLLQLGPGSFFPRPKVSSTFLEIRFRETLQPEIRDEALFQWTVRAAFGQRRKQLKNALTADGRFPAAVIQEALDRVAVDPSARGETLSIERFVRLANALAT